MYIKPNIQIICNVGSIMTRKPLNERVKMNGQWQYRQAARFAHYQLIINLPCYVMSAIVKQRTHTVSPLYGGDISHLGVTPSKVQV